MSGPYLRSDLYPVEHDHHGYCEPCDDCMDTPGRCHNNNDPQAAWFTCPTCNGHGCTATEDSPFRAEREFSPEQLKVIDALKAEPR